MPSLNLDLDYFEHRKTKRLVALLGRGADALPLRLWAYCGKFHSEDGVLSDYSVKEIEGICGWWGADGEMLAAMLRAGFLHSEGGVYLVHDWLEHQGHISAFKKKGRDNAIKRWGVKLENPNKTTLPDDTSIPASTATRYAPTELAELAELAERSKALKSPPPPPPDNGAPLLPKKKGRPKVTFGDDESGDAAWFKELADDIAYRGIHIEVEFSKMKRWCAQKGKPPTRTRFINWLNRADRPIGCEHRLETQPPAPAIERPHMVRHGPNGMTMIELTNLCQYAEQMKGTAGYALAAEVAFDNGAVAHKLTHLPRVPATPLPLDQIPAFVVGLPVKATTVT